MLPLVRLYGGRVTKGDADGRPNSGGGGLEVSEGELVAREHESNCPADALPHRVGRDLEARIIFVCQHRLRYTDQDSRLDKSRSSSLGQLDNSSSALTVSCLIP